MNIEDFNQLVTIELPKNKHLRQCASGDEVQQMIERTMNESFQRYIQLIPKENFVTFADSACSMGDEAYEELQSILTTALEERMYHYFNLGMETDFSEDLSYELIEHGDMLVFQELLSGISYEGFIRKILEFFISITMRANQEHLAEYVEEFREVDYPSSAELIADVQVINQQRGIRFSFKEKVQEKYLDTQLIVDTLSNRKNLYSMMMFAQGTGAELPKDIELLQSYHIKNYGKASYNLVLSYVEDYIDFISWVVNDLQYDNEFTDLLDADE